MANEDYWPETVLSYHLTVLAGLAKKTTPPDKAKAPAPDKADKWYDKPLNLAGAILAVVVPLTGIGYGAAVYKIGVEQALLNIQREQECNERVTQEKETCAEYRRSVEAEKMDNLVKTIESLQTVSKK